VPRASTAFARWLFVILGVASAIRFGYVALAKQGPCPTMLGEVPGECPSGDELFYGPAAQRLAAGFGFTDPFGAPEPAADHPPLTVVVLAAVSWLSRQFFPDLFGDATHLLLHRYTMALLGTLLVGCIAALGRRVAGDAVGLLAAGIAAASPNVWVHDGLVMSETPGALTVVAALYCALALGERPSLARAAALGASCGLAALTRAELLALVPLLALPAALGARPRRAGLAAVTLLASALVVGPWVLFNLSRFEAPALISTNDGITLAASNCAATYSGPGIGLAWIVGPHACIDHPHPPGDQSQVAAIYRRRALRYALDHLERVPVVVAARIGRTWSLYRPTDMIAIGEHEGREGWVTTLGLVAYYPTLLAALAGAGILWRARRRRELWVLLVPALCVTLATAITLGTSRYRATAEPSLAVLAAVALSTLAQNSSRKKSGGRPKRSLPASS
jgi:4-amino-4-deoxy-L-arabinose transferase-like glycosyltransferase